MSALEGGVLFNCSSNVFLNTSLAELIEPDQKALEQVFTLHAPPKVTNDWWLLILQLQMALVASIGLTVQGASTQSVHGVPLGQVIPFFVVNCLNENVETNCFTLKASCFAARSAQCL